MTCSHGRPASLRRSLASGFALALLGFFSSASAAHAHDIGKTQVTAVFTPDGKFSIDIVVDEPALLVKLQALNGEAVTDPDSQAGPRTTAAILARRDAVLDQITIAFDGVRVRPTLEVLPDAVPSTSGPAASLVRLTGRVPSEARQFTWSYSLVFGSYALVIRSGAGTATVTQWIEGRSVSEPYALAGLQPPPSRLAIARQYLTLGFTHIVPHGLDHILFVVGIFLLSTSWRAILLQVSTFTLAHSITLGLTMYGLIALPPRVVEPMIALSIAYVAIENLVTSELKPWRIALVFCFGLLHGMGFAGVLAELGLPRSEFLTALLTFNAGVEAGQLTVIGVAFLCVAAWRRDAAGYRRFVVQPASALIALVGLYWTVTRVL